MYQLVRNSLPDFERWQKITERRYEELGEMEAFSETNECLMRFLADVLEDPTYPQNCGRCKNCISWTTKFELTESQYQRAQQHLLQGDPIWIEPRKQWAGRNVITDKQRLGHLNEQGLTLSYYNDEGWGKLVKQGKYKQQHFHDRLVIASAELIRQQWGSQIQWVSCIPSSRHPRLVPDFAMRLAQKLNLPFVHAITIGNEYPEQKTMQNSYLQLNNIRDAFNISSSIPSTSVLLVDDIVDSGWSLTLVGWMLRERGVSHVYPFTLAKATGKM
jgi:ATP-dependent DNA helicase RecQ